MNYNLETSNKIYCAIPTVDFIKIPQEIKIQRNQNLYATDSKTAIKLQPNKYYLAHE